MKNSRTWRVTTNSLLWTAVLLLFTFLPFQIHAQIDANNAPQITSQPTLVVTTDQQYQYQLQATDQDNDQISFSLTSGPASMILKDSTITWQPTKSGSYNVIIQATDDNGGYDSQAWQITVAPGKVASIVITPNDRPTVINIGDNQQFTAKAYDQYNNEISDATFTWSTDEEFSSTDQQGFFVAKKGGITFMAATSDDVQASVGVVVKDTRSTLVTNEDTTEKTTEQVTEETTEQTVATETQAGTDEQTSTEGEVSLTNEQTTLTEEEAAAAEEESCTNIAHWLTFFILVIFALALILFYRFEAKRKSASWWVFPFLLTFIGLLIYYRNFCPQTYLWWPWVLVGIGAIITFYYKGRKRSGNIDDNSQTELPF